MSSSPTWRTWPMPGMFVWNQEPIVSRFECPRFIVLSNVCNPRGVSAAAAGSIRRDSISSLSHQRHLLIKMEGGAGKTLRFFLQFEKIYRISDRITPHGHCVSYKLDESRIFWSRGKRGGRPPFENKRKLCFCRLQSVLTIVVFWAAAMAGLDYETGTQLIGRLPQLLSSSCCRTWVSFHSSSSSSSSSHDLHITIHIHYHHQAAAALL